MQTTPKSTSLTVTGDTTTASTPGATTPVNTNIENVGKRPIPAVASSDVTPTQTTTVSSTTGQYNNWGPLE